jgi:hypothetical protein
VVAVATPSAPDLKRPARRSAAFAWSVATAALVVGGLSMRLLLGGGGQGDHAAIVMASLLSVGVWVAALLLSTPRVAFLATLAAVAVLDVAALPARNSPEYDDREAFFRPDQVITASVPNPATTAQPVLVLLVEPVFPESAAQPRFGLAGDVASATALAWDCTFRRGLQHLALPLPAAAVASAGPIDVRLHLTGSPSRESDYMLVYASAPRGGFLVSLVAAADAGPGATLCALRP